MILLRIPKIHLRNLTTSSNIIISEWGTEVGEKGNGTLYDIPADNTTLYAYGKLKYNYFIVNYIDALGVIGSITIYNSRNGYSFYGVAKCNSDIVGFTEIGDCMQTYPTTIPFYKIKKETIQLPGALEKTTRLIVHCNSFHLMTITLSDEFCDLADWRKTWERTPTKIYFSTSDYTLRFKWTGEN